MYWEVKWELDAKRTTDRNSKGRVSAVNATDEAVSCHNELLVLPVRYLMLYMKIERWKTVWHPASPLNIAQIAWQPLERS